jgi:hypothetical protein
MNDRVDRRRFLGAAAIAAAGGPVLLAQPPGPGEREVEAAVLPLDKPGVWTLHFRYKPPRIIQVPLFDKVKNQKVDKSIWYMFFQVYNKYSDPVVFLPKFDLVTKDLNTLHLDEPHPILVEHIRKIEDPEKVLNPPIQTTIDISRKPIPPTKPDSIARVISGAAIWTDMAERAPKTNKFSIYVVGLSNGLATEETPDKRKFIKQKVLRLDFVRPTDDNNPNPTDIRPDPGNTGQSETWIYRSVRQLNEAEGKKD